MTDVDWRTYPENDTPSAGARILVADGYTGSGTGTEVLAPYDQGSSLPPGGTVGQIVVNTGPGEGDWGDNYWIGTTAEYEALGSYDPNRLYVRTDDPPLEQTGTSYTMKASDNSRKVRMTNAAAVTVTIDPQSTTPTTLGHRTLFRAAGAGGLVLSPGAGVTLNGNTGCTVNQAISVEHVSGDEWDLTGGTVA